MGAKSKISWTAIPGHLGYWITADGLVSSEWRKRGQGRGKAPIHYLSGTHRRLKPFLAKDGYRYVQLGRGKRRKLATLVLTSFVGPRPAGMECRHLDGNKLNDQLDNLAWGTSLQNSEDQRRHGTMIGGEKHGSAKLTNADVAAIHRLRQLGMKQYEIASQFGVRQSTISVILAGKSRTTGSHEGKGR